MSIINEIETEFFMEYVKELDHTIIYEQKTYRGTPVSLEIIGWYYGDEDAATVERLVKEYLQGDSRLKAVYDFIDEDANA